MAVAYTFSSPIPSAFLCLCYYLPYPYLHGTVKPEYASLVPRYRSKWQDHVGTSALRCRSLASYVPLCSDLSVSASYTAACIAGRSRSYDRRFLRYDGSIPGPLPLICPSQRILNSCSALIKYRRVQTSLHRIIIRFESCLLSIILATLPFLSFTSFMHITV